MTTPLVVIGAVVLIAAWVMRDKWQASALEASGFIVFVSLIGLFSLWRSGTWRLADSVTEYPEGLRIRRGDTDLLVTYREIARIRHRADLGQTVCILDLHTAGELGSSIEFLPLTDEESMTQLNIDLWDYLEKKISNAQPQSAG